MSQKRTCYFGCQNIASLHSFPKEPGLRRQWEHFISPFGKTKTPGSLYLCSRHFKDSSFVNKKQFDAGFCQRLVVKRNAVPTLYGPNREATSEASTSQDGVEYNHELGYKISHRRQFKPRTVSIGIQVDMSLSTSTTLPLKTCKTEQDHMRSQVSQACVGTEDRLDTEPECHGQEFHSAKRPRLEIKKEEEDSYEHDSKSFVLQHESTHKPGESVMEHFQLSDCGMGSPTHYNDRKYIVFERCLRALFQTCPVCQRDCEVDQLRKGTFVAFKQLCPNCQFCRNWQSQPLTRQTPVGDIMMSAAVYFTGGSYTQVDKTMKAMNIQTLQTDEFRQHTRNYLEPAIVHKWKTQQRTLTEQLQKEGKVPIGGDMRADSPGDDKTILHGCSQARVMKCVMCTGHTFGSYTVMHLDSNQIIDVQLVQRNEVGGNVNMEMEGLRRCLNYLTKNKITVEHMVTNRHTQVQKYVRDNDIEQYNDVWHLVKGLSKKLEKLAKSKECQVVRKWLPAIKNHMFWTAVTSETGPEKVAKWKSLLNHIQNIHTHDDPLFPKCAHPERATTDPNKWFKPGSKSTCQVKKLLLNKKVLEDVERLSSKHQTSALESFHQLRLRFAPKNAVFSYTGMLCRLYLAALHYNENVVRNQASTQQDTARYRVSFSKHRKGTVKALKEAPTYDYASDLMKLVFEEVLLEPHKFMSELKELNITDTQSAQLDSLFKEEPVDRLVSQFSGELERTHQTDDTEWEVPRV
ncbi:uncharacterized protein LOC128765918 isoform X1 [Synchiropus splendidus]|uniref:uncharacterized protein LOC128765918 isoform X1 n=1 Tax=Synchiropus splendidus TaxID=270530 RepID=UPI00237ED251|nr:uncharacterized protein LOC128765918 isoform X1 [Synchiropus splendidus]